MHSDAAMLVSQTGPGWKTKLNKAATNKQANCHSDVSMTRAGFARNAAAYTKFFDLFLASFILLCWKVLSSIHRYFSCQQCFC